MEEDGLIRIRTHKNEEYACTHARTYVRTHESGNTQRRWSTNIKRTTSDKMNGRRRLLFVNNERRREVEMMNNRIWFPEQLFFDWYFAEGTGCPKCRTDHTQDSQANYYQ